MTLHDLYYCLLKQFAMSNSEYDCEANINSHDEPFIAIGKRGELTEFVVNKVGDDRFRVKDCETFKDEYVTSREIIERFTEN